VYLPGTCPTVVCDESVWGNLKHVLLSAIALGGGRSAILTRLLRASMPEVIRMEYITAARPKGLVEEARHQQTCAEERPDPHGDDNGAAGGPFDRWRHRRGDAIRYPWPGDLRHQRHHHARLPAGARVYPGGPTPQILYFGAELTKASSHGYNSRRDGP
jgi:hypothetical protein